MTRLFISHSSEDDRHAIALADWLGAEGWDDIFLDLDPVRGIVGGELWERRLAEEAALCEAVLFLISRAWLRSEWCLKEYAFTERLGKRAIPALIEPIPIDDLPAGMTEKWQVVDLFVGADHRMFHPVHPGGKALSPVTLSLSGLARLRAGLQRAGLDPEFFAWSPEGEPGRSPYRGLKPLDREDAGVFFGREGPIFDALEALRELRAAPEPRFLAILGASGAGKSSFMRAGLLPRLQRNRRLFLPLPPIRPERAALSGEGGFLRALEAALRDHGAPASRAELRAAISSGAEGVAPILSRLAEAGRQPDGEAPAIIIAIDQAEELFLSDERASAEAKVFLTLLGVLLTRPEPATIALATIRTDAYEPLQSAPELSGIPLQHTFSLAPMPLGAYRAVIAGPAERMTKAGRKLAIEPPLVDALLADIDEGAAKDALPLLAFTMERLFEEHGGDGDLKLSEYRELGGVIGSIEAAVEGALRAMDGDERIPREAGARRALLRRAFIPWLAGVDPETKAPRRRVARRAEIPAEALPLVDHLVAARLLSTDRDAETGEATVEPAHEALLRRWGMLEGWLEEDFATLAALEGVRRAARDWAANARAEGWLAHAGERLAEAEAAAGREDVGGLLDPTDRAYLAECRRDVDARRAQELAQTQALAAARRRSGRFLAGGLAASLLLAATAGWFGWDARNEALRADGEAAAAVKARDEAVEQERLARVAELQARNNAAGALAALSSVELSKGRPVEATKLALAAWQRIEDDKPLKLDAAIRGLSAALPENNERLQFIGHTDVIKSVVLWEEGVRVLTGSKDKSARLWDAATGKEIMRFGGHQGAVNSVAISANGTHVVTGSDDTTARLWDAATGAEIRRFEGHSSWVTSVALSADGAKILAGSDDATARLWDAATGAEIRRFDGHRSWITSVAFSADGTRVLTGSEDGTARLWNAATGLERRRFDGHSSWVTSAALSADGLIILTGLGDNTARLWNALTGAEVRRFEGHDYWVMSVALSADGERVLTGSLDSTARLWDSSTGKEIARFEGHRDGVMAVALS